MYIAIFGAIVCSCSISYYFLVKMPVWFAFLAMPFCYACKPNINHQWCLSQVLIAWFTMSVSLMPACTPPFLPTVQVYTYTALHKCLAM